MTKLTEYFTLNRDLFNENSNELRLKHTYATICQDFAWHEEMKSWEKRTYAIDKIVRVGSVGPGNVELQVCMQLLCRLTYEIIRLKGHY